MATMDGNVKIEVKGNIMTVTIDLSKDLGPSASGKTRLVATTRGGVRVGETGVSANISAYRKA